MVADTQANQLKNSAMIRKALAVAWPAMMESFFVTLAGMIDTMMVSALGSYAVAAVGLTAQPKFIGLTLFIGINVAVSALVARRKGEQRREDAHEIVWTAILLTILLCAIVTVLFVVFAPGMMILAGSNADTHDERGADHGGLVFEGGVTDTRTRLMDHETRVGQGCTVTFLTARCDHCTHTYNRIDSSIQHHFFGVLERVPQKTRDKLLFRKKRKIQNDTKLPQQLTNEKRLKNQS